MKYVDEEDLEEDRRTLLKYYSSQSSQHIAYVLTLSIGFFTFIQALQYLKLAGVSRDVLVSVLLSSFLTIFWYLLLRTFFWGTLSSLACYHRPISEEEYCRRVAYEYNKKIVCITTLQRLNFECIDAYKRDHLIRYYAMKPKSCALLWLVSSVIAYYLLSQLAVL